uniref:BTB domain-containing protein n=1 Tax=Panagrolaimus davidi TaxID=227884 RepID=A0A914PNB3_9BILA
MKSMNYINKLRSQLEIAFKSQDLELIDIVFEIEGKKLYADKLILSMNSSTFKSMLSDRWISKNDSIKIETYKYEDFKELLRFIYSGKCNITNENILTILDMSEFYQIEDLKELCDEYLSKMELNLSNIIQLFEISNKYSLIQTKKPIQTFIFQNYANSAEFDGFLNAEKYVAKEIIAVGQTFAIKYEEMFQAAFEWSENQAIKKQKEANVENFNINDAIKVEMEEFLPFIKFNQMEHSFFTEYIVKVTNKNGQSIFGLLPKNSNAVSVIKSLKDNCSDYWGFWKANCRKPLTPSLLKKRIGAKCYLTFFDRYIGMNSCLTDNHSLLAEMYSETVFSFTSKYKIEIV